MSLPGKFVSLGFAAALFAFAALSTSADAQGRRSECGEYASQAVDQYEQSRRMRCGYEGPRWSDARESHFGWCLITPRGAEEEGRIRSRMLQECRDRRAGGGGGGYGGGGGGGRNLDAKRAGCDTYAKIAEVQAEANQKYNCDFRGPEWTAHKRPHYDWCMTNRRDYMVDQIRYRATELQKCFNNLGDYDDDNYDRNYRRRF